MRIPCIYSKGDHNNPLMVDSPKRTAMGTGDGVRRTSLMETLLGLLRIRIKRGVNLAVRDVRSSDPYVVVKMGKQVIFLLLHSFFSSSYYLLFKIKIISILNIDYICVL